VSGEVAFGVAISEDRKIASVVAAGRERARVAIDPNVRVRGNDTFTSLEDVTGSVAAGDAVEVYEPESGLAGDGVITEVDEARKLVYLSVSWPSLVVTPTRLGLAAGAALRVLIDLSPYYGHPRGVVAALAELYEKHDPVAVVVNAKAQSGTLVEPLKNAGIIAVLPSAEQVAVAHGDFLDLVNDGGLAHLDQLPLTAAVRAGQQRPLAGAKAWDPKVAVDQGPLVAATLATWAFLRWEELATPGVWQI
jgi:hypothetical protein